MFYFYVMKLRGLVILVLYCAQSTLLLSQIDKSFPAPNQPLFDPMFGSTSVENPQKAPAKPHSSFHRGLHAKDVMRMAQSQSYNRVGLPYYPPNATSEQIQKINREHVHRLIAESQPSASNGFKQQNAQESTRTQLLNLLNESHRNRLVVRKSKYKVSPRYYEDLPNYQKAKKEIKDQLSGKKPLSLKNAYFFAEAAYGDTYLGYDEFSNLIEKNKNYILEWLSQNGFDLNDPEALHYGIQSFLSDTLSLKVPNPEKNHGASSIVHFPFYYDYVDNEAIKDRRNYFVTKTMATGTGQCHTLPITYLIMAEALGVDANITFIPLHSTIRYKNNEGVTLNYETTVDKFLPDQVYLDMQPAMAKGMKNGIFMKDMTKQQLVSTILIDLGVSFILEHWFADAEIVDDCIRTAESYFPQEEYINTSSLWIKKKTLSNRFNAVVEEKGIQDLKEIERFPEVNAAYQNLKHFLERAKAIGLEDFPESEYIKLMTYHDKQERLQLKIGQDTKTKKDLFLKL